MQRQRDAAFYQNRSDTSDELIVTHGENIFFPLHLHPEVELFLIESGRVRVETGQGHSQELGPGGFAFFFPNTAHGYQTAGGESRFLLVIGHPSLFGDLFSTLAYSRPASACVPRERLHPDIPYALSRLCGEGAAPGRETARALLHLILARFLEETALEPVREPKSPDLTTRLVEYLSQHYRSPLTLDDAARALCVSRCHISHVLSRRLGTSFTEYLNALRANDARAQLLHSDRSISDICLDCGFSSQRTFNRVFQERFHCTPRECRTLKKGKT